MAQRTTLTEAQVGILRWIDNGCPEGVREGDRHRISVAALRGRGLVVTSGRGPSWTATITDAGREYLAKVDGPNPPTPKQANVSVTQQLVDDVIAAGGSLRVPRKFWGEPGHVDYENRARLAHRYGKVPDGKALKATIVSRNEFQIDLIEPQEGIVHAVPTRPVPVPNQVRKYHPVVREFRDQNDRHEVSRAALPRVLRLIHGLATEAERRGHKVSIVPEMKNEWG